MFNIKKIKILLSSLMLHQFYLKKLEAFLDKSNDLENTIFYTYWNNESTYALQSLKEKYGYKIVSRIHGGDIYEKRREFGYLPLKKQFTHNIDRIYTITQSANDYLIERYGFKKESIALSRLGVRDLSINTLSSTSNDIHLVSCSFLSEVKRVDKIIEALALLSIKQPHVNFKWSHMGDGYLYKELLVLADKKLKGKSNITFTFLGNLKNVEVYEFYKNNNVDLFINVSQSEGVPVSIMEAMSCHIPIIAPNVGGVKDMVTDGQNGRLLSERCEVSEIIEALDDIEFYKEPNIRENAYQVYIEKYSASLNYNRFITSMVEL
jgi:glycosyltransferase involved in cell wall biosynthesis